MKKLIYVNPAAGHNVFLWWHYFFSQYYNYHTYHHDTPSSYEKNHFLQYKHIIKIGKNFVVFYKKPEIKIDKDDIMIIWDIFTNSLVYKSYRSKNILYYSEFFLFWKSLWKKIFFYITTLFFFRHKKMIVPTKLAYNTYKKTVKNVLYMPTLYHDEIHIHTHQNKWTIKLLFVWRVSQTYKNIYFLIDNYLSMKKTGHNISLTIVWAIEEEWFMQKYQNELEIGAFTYLGVKNKEELHDIYLEHDVFILPSNSDPIGAVILEAMAHGLAIITSDSVGASCYIEEWVNWYIFKTNDSIDFQNKLELLINIHNLWVYKQASYDIVKNKYRVKNTTVRADYYKKLTTFISSK